MMVRMHKRGPRHPRGPGVLIQAVDAPEGTEAVSLTNDQLRYAEHELPARHFHDMDSGWQIALEITPAQAKVLLPHHN